MSADKSPILGADAELQSDVLLLQFLRSSGDASEVYLSELLAEQTESTIKGIIRSRLRVSLSSTDGSHNNQDAMDLVTEVQTDLLVGLRRLKNEPGPRAIGNFHNYVATAAFNACHQWLRRKYPQRLRLKNKLRYLLTHAPEFALWETAEREWFCGFTSWRNTPPASAPALRQTAGRGQGRDAFIDSLTAIFKSLNKPALLEDVVTLMADSLGIKENAPHGDRAPGWEEAEAKAHPEPQAGILTELEQRAELQKLWSAVCRLPLNHRAALLLNLRDKRGADALELLPHTRVATIAQIGNALAFGPEEFARVWNQLPWDDLNIARHLGLTRQQVINLRQSARARLARELRGV